MAHYQDLLAIKPSCEIWAHVTGDHVIGKAIIELIWRSNQECIKYLKKLFNEGPKLPLYREINLIWAEEACEMGRSCDSPP